jgi:hypothetical protein
MTVVPGGNQEDQFVNDQELEAEGLVELPARLETSSFFSPVIVVNPQIAIAINGVNFGDAQVAGALNMAGLGLSLK